MWCRPAATCSASSSASRVTGARLRRGLHARTPVPTGRSSTPCSTRASTCRRAPTRRGSSPPPTTTGRCSTCSTRCPLLPRPLRRRADPNDARRERPVKTDRPSAAPRRGAQPAGHPLRALGPGFHLSERGRAMADRVADRIGDRDITYIVVLPARAGAGDRRAARGGARSHGRARRAGDRVQQHLRGQAVQRPRLDPAPAAGVDQALEPVQPVVG